MEEEGEKEREIIWPSLNSNPLVRLHGPKGFQHPLHLSRTKAHQGVCHPGSHLVLAWREKRRTTPPELGSGRPGCQSYSLGRSGCYIYSLGRSRCHSYSTETISSTGSHEEGTEQAKGPAPVGWEPNGRSQSPQGIWMEAQRKKSASTEGAFSCWQSTSNYSRT